MTKAGKLDRLVVIQSRTVEQNEYGEEIETWSDSATAWARFLPGGGDERFSAASVYASTEARFQLRWRSDITSQNRLIYDAKIWDILLVTEIGRREGIELKAKASG